jgi:hypothetical protein
VDPDPEPHQIERLDPYPHQIDKPDPNPHQSDKPDPDPHLHLSDKQDPDPHQSDKPDPDPHKSDTNPQHWLCFYLSSSQCCGSGSDSGSTGSTSFWASRFRLLLSSCKNSKKNLDSYYFVTVFDFSSLKNDVNVPSKSKKQKKLS